MGPSHFIACNDRTVYSWQFSTTNQNIAASVNSYKRGDTSDDADTGKIIYFLCIFMAYFFSAFELF